MSKNYYNCSIGDTLVVAGGSAHDFESCGQIISAELEKYSFVKLFNPASDEDIFDSLDDEIRLLVLYFDGGSLSRKDEAKLISWVYSGGGFVGVHGALASFGSSPGYSGLIGGEYIGHTNYAAFKIDMLNEEHPALGELKEDSYLCIDEIYLADPGDDVEVLAKTRYDGKELPLLWSATRGSGRILWIGLGHTPESCGQDPFGSILRGGAFWAAKAR